MVEFHRRRSVCAIRSMVAGAGWVGVGGTGWVVGGGAVPQRITPQATSLGPVPSLTKWAFNQPEFPPAGDVGRVMLS